MTAPPTNPERLLVLDDDPFMLKLLQRMLAQHGYTQVDAFDAGRKALEQLKAAPEAYRLILLDIHMPEMDGVEFIRQLAECRYKGDILLISGEAGRILESVQRLIESHHLHALGHLQKPVRPGDLAVLLHKLKPRTGQLTPQSAGQPSFSVAELRDAIDRAEFVNYYQPKVNLTSSAVVGVECLVRWQHPRSGLVFPDAFIGLAEQHGLITALSRMVLTAAMNQVKLWSLAGVHVPVAVNIAMDDLTALDFPDLAAELARSIGIDPALITLEVTEGQMMRRLSTVLDVITRLELKRFRLSIDDFGTGHSSLTQLRELPFDELKLDRSFVHGASTDATRRAICSASVRMAHQLNVTVVGEGIEDREDWDLLQNLGCDIGQGYFIAKPMPASHVITWLGAWSARHGISDSQLG